MKTFKSIFTLASIFFIVAALRVYSQPVTSNENNIKFENPTTATLVGQDGLAMRTEDTGENWVVLTTGVTNVLNSNDFISVSNPLAADFTVHLVVGENGIILKSVDNGVNWTVMPSNTIEHLNDVKILSTRTINSVGIPANAEYMTYATGDNGVLLYSSDLGDNWTVIPTGTTENLNQLTFLYGTTLNTDQVTAVVTGTNGTVIVSKDFGQNWLRTVTGTTEELNSVSSVGNDVYFAVGNNGTMIFSTDAGNTWEVKTTEIVENINDIKFLGDLTVGIAVCDNGIMLRTSDGGLTWDSLLTPSVNDLYSVSFSTPEFGIAVGDSSTELYSSDGGLTWVNREIIIPMVNFNDDKKNSEVKLNQNYPNPFNPSTMINYELPFSANVSVKIYDMLGKEVRTLASGFQAPGAYSVSFNASSLASGIYFYVLRANTNGNEIVKTMRMILTK